MSPPVSHDVLVVGAGPAGSTVAACLARAGRSVLLLEEHAQVGTPVHCTGIVGPEVFEEFALPRSLITSTLDNFVVHGPHGGCFSLPLTVRSQAFALCRASLDRYLAEAAVAAGATLLCNARVDRVEGAEGGKGVRVWVGSRRQQGPLAPQVFEASVCILACGAMSSLPENSGLLGPRIHHRTAQVEVSGVGLRGAHVFLGQQVAPGSFGYVASTGEGRGKVGLISRGSAHLGHARLLGELAGRGWIAGDWGRVTARRIPMGPARRSFRGAVVCVGDAAGQAKTTTGGGIYYSMLCARTLAEHLLAQPNDSRGFHRAMRGYEAAWQRRLGSELNAGLWLRRCLERVTDDEVERLVALAAGPQVQDLLVREWSFDAHAQALLSLLGEREIRQVLLQMAARRLAPRHLQRLVRFEFAQASSRPL